MNSMECCCSSSNGLIPFFPKECIMLRSKEKKLIRVEAPFIDEISGLAIMKVLHKNIQNAMILKLKFT